MLSSVLCLRASDNRAREGKSGGRYHAPKALNCRLDFFWTTPIARMRSAAVSLPQSQ